MLLKNGPSGAPSLKSCRAGVQEPLVLRTSPPGHFDVCQSARQTLISFSPRRSWVSSNPSHSCPGQVHQPRGPQGRVKPRQTGEASLAHSLKRDFSF